MIKQVNHRGNRMAIFSAVAIACLMAWHSPLFVEPTDGSDAGPNTLRAGASIASISPDEREIMTETAPEAVDFQSHPVAREPWAIQLFTERTRSGILRGFPARITRRCQETQSVPVPLRIDRHFAGILAAAGYGGRQVLVAPRVSMTTRAPLPIDRHFAGILAAAGYGGPRRVGISRGSMRAEAPLPIDRHFAGILAAAGYGRQHVVRISRGSMRAGAPLPIDRHFAGILAAAGYGGRHSLHRSRTILTAKTMIRVVSPHRADPGGSRIRTEQPLNHGIAKNKAGTNSSI